MAERARLEQAAGASRAGAFVSPADAIVEYCRRHGIRKLALFGSVLRDDFHPDSDVDVLVEYAPGQVPGLGFFSHQDELSKILGWKVDLNTPELISKYFRYEVFGEAITIYAGT